MKHSPDNGSDLQELHISEFRTLSNVQGHSKSSGWVPELAKEA